MSDYEAPMSSMEEYPGGRPYRSDAQPCISAGEHLKAQRHTRSWCPAEQPEEPRIVRIDIATLETLKDAAAFRFDSGTPWGETEAEDLQKAIDTATLLIEPEPTKCGDPNPLQPGLTCTLLGNHGSPHAADSAMGHHTWSPA